VNRRIVHEQVCGWGMRATTVRSGEAALAARIKAEPSLGVAVVIMRSSLHRLREAAYTGGGAVDACLSKPIRSAHLLRTLHASWSRKT